MRNIESLPEDGYHELSHLTGDHEETVATGVGEDASSANYHHTRRACKPAHHAWDLRLIRLGGKVFVYRTARCPSQR
jgi:hypothetical protein